MNKSGSLLRNQTRISRATARVEATGNTREVRLLGDRHRRAGHLGAGLQATQDLQDDWSLSYTRNAITGPCLGKQPMPALPSSSLLFHGNIPFLNRSDKSLSSTTVRSNGSPKIISIDFRIDP